MSYFHTWSLSPHHFKSSNLQQFLPVKVQTLLWCYIKSRWWHERDNREHLPMWSSSCQHPQPQSLGHTTENHLKISLTEKHFYTPCSNVEQASWRRIWSLSMLKSIPRMATAMQPAINPLGVFAGGWPALLNQKNLPFKPSFAAIKIHFVKTHQGRNPDLRPFAGFCVSDCGFCARFAGQFWVRKNLKIDDLLFCGELPSQICGVNTCESYVFCMTALGLVNNAK